MKFIEESDNPLCTRNLISDSTKVCLFQQFFLHKNEERRKEIQYCLRKNLMNTHITDIYLLNDIGRPYTKDELGVDGGLKIHQLFLKRRLKYSDVIELIDSLKLIAYVIIANADIFFDDSLNNLLSVDLVFNKQVFCQLRWEFEGENKPVNIFSNRGVPRIDSQDAWIYHSHHNDLLYKHIRAFNFELGQAGCDNHITYLFKILGFGIINDPVFIHCLHYHKTQIREYTQENRILSPYLLINPIGVPLFKRNDKLSFYDNNELENYVREKLNKNLKFIIPRIAGRENNTAHRRKYETCHPVDMKEKAGIFLSTQKSVEKYSDMYLKAFINCEIYTGWKKDCHVYAGIRASQDFVEDHIAVNSRMYWAFALDIFHYIHYKPWTLALKGKRVLIVSAFCDTISKQIINREKHYGIDLFPDCEFVFIKPPQTHGRNPSLEWDIELKIFTDKLDLQREHYDVALVSSGGYGNLICNYIYEQHNKSAIYVGGVLQMYFGVYGGRWLTERTSVVKMYLNEYWVRPSAQERPADYQSIENGCYF